MEFVSAGKGLAASHAAADCSYQWKEYGEMLGGYFNGHPWQKINVRVEDPAHPLNAAFTAEGFEIADEIYTYKDPYSRQKQRILLSIDLEKSKLEKSNRPDRDHAMAWIKTHGKGRIFYSAFGHRHEIFWNKSILRHYLDGIQFALGDLNADTTPVPAPKPAAGEGTPKAP